MGSKDRIDPERDCVMLDFLKSGKQKAKPFAHNERILREMPWLWAVKRAWGSSDRITIIQIDKEFWFAQASVQVLSEIYIHTVMDQAERVHNLEYTGVSCNMYDALVDLHEKVGTHLKFVRHVAIKLGEETLVYRARTGTSFGELFDEDPRTLATPRGARRYSADLIRG
jgi:hypothetical protein